MSYLMSRYMRSIRGKDAELELHKKILEYLGPRKSFSPAELQGELGLSYYEVKNAIEKMLGFGMIRYESDATYLYDSLNEDQNEKRFEEEMEELLRARDEDLDEDMRDNIRRDPFRDFQSYTMFRNYLNKKHGDNNSNNNDDGDSDESDNSDGDISVNNDKYTSAVEKYRMILNRIFDKDGSGDDDDDDDDDDKDLLDEVEGLFDDGDDSDDSDDSDDGDGDSDDGGDN